MLARQLALQRPCVLKLLPRGHDPVISARFSREAEALGRLNHPACIDVFDHGQWRGWLYLAIAWVEGDVLEQRLGEPWDPFEAVQIALQVARGLEHAHARGVSHRDLQPTRIVLSSDPDIGVRAHLVDFGLARIEDMEPDTTAGRAPLGLPGYLAPERVDGDRGGPAGDVYGVGVLLYEMLTGISPFRRSSPVETLAAQAAGDCAPLERHLPADRRTQPLLWVVDRSIRADPSQRIPDGAELTRALLAARASLVDPSLASTAPWLDGGRVQLASPLLEAIEVATPALLARRTVAPVPPRRGASVGVLLAGFGLLVVGAVLSFAVLLIALLWWMQAAG